MRPATLATLAHLLAVGGAAFALVVLIPHPELWAHLPGAADAYSFAMKRTGGLHIVLGALAAWLYSRQVFGTRRANVFLGLALGISLGFELVGTGTGWPFGTYRYTDGLGPKVLGLVPFVIPFSWYYLALAAYVIARRLSFRFWPAHPEVGAVLLGTWLLVAWDLVLDPAMAHEDLPLKFWVWSERGAYLGMPLVNLAGWLACGSLIMGSSRLAWGAIEPVAHDAPIGIPAAIYLGNLAFGAIICLDLGLISPIFYAGLAGLVPTLFALFRSQSPSIPSQSSAV